ncbi:MAG: CoB--CoM heterodisulfide reductase iron-sulfur subunit B family protein, partial [Candidatus Aminicenantales bacterium]
CYNTLKRANERMKASPEDLETLNDFMSKEDIAYNGEVRVLHLLEILRDEVTFKTLSEKITKPLKDLRVASYYGCLLVRPKEIGFDDPENPTVLEDLMTHLGSVPVDFPLKTECCGAYQTVDKPGIIAERTQQILSSARSMGAEVVVVSCPLCAFNLDQRQKKARELFPEFQSIPVLYFTQPLAMALGCPEKSLGFDLHFIDPKPILKEKGLI